MYLSLLLCGVACAVCALALEARAESSVVNNVSVTSSSSGGKSSSSASVKTIVNGETVEDYTETTTDGVIRYESTINEDDVSVDTSVHVEAETGVGAVIPSPSVVSTKLSEHELRQVITFLESVLGQLLRLLP